MLKKQVIGIGLITLLIVLVIYSRIEHNTEQNIENLSYQELEEELIKLEDEYREKHLDMSKKEKADIINIIEAIFVLEFTKRLGNILGKI